MKKSATCTVSFTFDWTTIDEINPLADEYHYAELYLASALGNCGYKGMCDAEVDCVEVKDVETTNKERK